MVGPGRRKAERGQVKARAREGELQVFSCRVRCVVCCSSNAAVQRQQSGYERVSARSKAEIRQLLQQLLRHIRNLRCTTNQCLGSGASVLL